MLALHYEMVGACPLNWSAGRKQNEALLDLLDIPRGELVIMLIGLGTLPETLNVAVSPRRPLSDVLIERHG